ncbi:hypothetical protein ACT3R7_11775 [Halomonas sp. AOP43-A1-21]
MQLPSDITNALTRMKTNAAVDELRKTCQHLQEMGHTEAALLVGRRADLLLGGQQPSAVKPAARPGPLPPPPHGVRTTLHTSRRSTSHE